MLIIQKIADNYRKIVGEQNYITDVEYIKSPYLKEVDYDNHHLVYNRLTGEIIALEDEEINTVDVFEWLVKHWFYFAEHADPFSIAYLARQNVTTINRPKEINHFVVTTTTNCNARCYYCYEAGCIQKTMDAKTALNVAKYITQKSGNNVSVSWFGGEPLCNPTAIRTICNHFKSIGKNYMSTMISNGYLLSEFSEDEIVNEWKLKNIQITLDGTKEQYQYAKNYKNEDPNAYERVLDNIEMLLRNKISVSIRSNISLKNGKDVLNLITELCNRFKQYSEYLSIYPSALFDGMGDPPVEFTEEEYNTIIQYIIDIYEQIRVSGLNSGMKGKLVCPSCHCMADKECPIVITPSGHLSPCEHYVDDSSEICGDIYNDVTDWNILKNWKEEFFTKECKDCPLFPKCYRIKKCPTDGKCNIGVRKLLDYKDELMIKETYDINKRLYFEKHRN